MVMLQLLAGTPAANAAATYAMKSTQHVFTRPSLDAPVMGAVFAGERVLLYCQDSDRSKRLYSYVEFQVDKSPGFVKRGFVLDRELRTGTPGRVPGVQFGHCPRPLTAPGARLVVGKPDKVVPPHGSRTCWDRGAGWFMENRLGMKLFDGRIELHWCADILGGAITDVSVNDGRTKVLNSILATDPKMDVRLTSGSRLGASQTVKVAVAWSAARTWKVHGTVEGEVSATSGDLEASTGASLGVDLEPGPGVISRLLTLTSVGGFSDDPR